MVNSAVRVDEGNITDHIELGHGAALRKRLRVMYAKEAQALLDCVPVDKRNSLWVAMSSDFGLKKIPNITDLLSRKEKNID